MLREFINKRSMHINESMRNLANVCVTKCNKLGQPYPGPATPDQEEPRALPKFTLNEEVCLAKCQAKVMELTKVVERHIDDSFNPAFVKKFI